MEENNKDNFWDDDSSQFQTTDDDNEFTLDAPVGDDDEDEEELDDDEEDIDDSEDSDDEDSEEDDEESDPLFEQGFELFKDNIFQNLPEGYEFKPTEKGFADAISKAEEGIFERVHGQYLAHLDGNKKASSYLDFLIETKGNGDFDKWIKNNEGQIYSESDLDSEDAQKAVISQLYKMQGLDDEDIESKLEDLENLDLLEKEAKIALKYIDKARDKGNQDLIDEGKNIEREQAELYHSNLNILNDTLNGTKIPNQRKRNIVDTIMKPLPLKDGGTITMYDYKLSQIRSHPQHIIDLTNLLLDYDFEKGFNLEKVIKSKSNTRNTKTIREKLEELDNSSTISKSKSNKSIKRSKQGPDLSEITFNIG